MAIAPGSVFWDGSKFVLYYSASNSTDTSLGNTGKPGFGLATSPNSITWTKQGEVFSNGTDYNQRANENCGSIGSLHSQAYFRFPDVMKIGGTYYMWYSRAFAIRLATSNDGVNWTVQNGGCAVLFSADWNDPSPPPNQAPVHGYVWDGDWVSYPSVFYDPVAKNFKMFYSGCDIDCTIVRTGFATSTDGVAWTKYVGNSVLSPTPGGFDNSDWTADGAALLVNGTIMMYYSADTASSLMCREGYSGDSACSNNEGFTATGIGLASISEVPLNQGWNLVSVPVVPSNNAITSVLAPQIAANDFTAVWSYQGGKWIYATLSNGKLSGSLKTIQDGLGYWIYMTTADTLLVGGTVIPPASAPPSYSLSAGWNLVGFKPQPVMVSKPVGQFLKSISGSYDPSTVWAWDNYAESWIEASADTPLIPGQAFWIYVTASAGATLRPS